MKDSVFFSKKDERPNGGRLAYEMYQRIFGSLFSPKFDDLDEKSQQDWLLYYKQLTDAFVVSVKTHGLSITKANENR